MKLNHASLMQNHPCFSKEAHGKRGRIHLPVAPACNIQCRYCLRKYDCANESRPGVTSVVLSPSEALERVRNLVERDLRLGVIGIAGPGDPLANEATFETMRAVNREFPHLILCISTNGLALNDRIDDLMKSGVRSVTITINASRPEIAEKVYKWVIYRGRKYDGREAAELLLANQWSGLINAIEAGFLIKVNSVLIPGVNDKEITLVAEKAGEAGADIHNIIPLNPQAEFSHVKRPSREDIHLLRLECGVSIPQMSHCRQCRADACGTLDDNKDMESEVLAARIGEEYEMMN
ncbi:MAG TPA: nitrogenase cofactor biosynthesis protein NifB [Dissulfurispiraceae bacterium]|nr:nitrogenase cofactor biosynthesis protein NifB [Dissulfurispiraceae bacterium]